VFVLPAIDHRFHWSSVPVLAVIAGDVLVALGLLIVFFVFRQNQFASASIETAAGQRVVSTGLYGLVRHPMYLGALVMVAGIPIALGSWWGLCTVVPMAGVLVWRLVDEERFLERNLAGYREYQARVKRRLIPFLW
jgi:protein-S-isoprenylcysteine O-methyltransferase Ste14